MSSLVTASIVFSCVFGGAVLGMAMSAVLPRHHLSSDTKDVVKLSMGLVATMTALVLGLLVASAKGAYDTEKAETIQMAAKVAVLDRALANYGPDAAPTRALLRRVAERVVASMWPDEASRPAQLNPTASRGEPLFDSIQELSPRDDAQRALKSLAIAGAIDLGQMRWLLFEQSGSSVSRPLLVVVVAWLAIIFLSFGLFAPRNGTVLVALMVAAMSVSGAILLILELDRPFDGLIQISSEPMRNMLNQLGK